MKYRSELANITMADIQGLDRARQCLRAVHDAVSATSMQGKASSLALLSEADDRIEAVMRKGARRAVRLGLAGAFQRKHLSQAFLNRVLALADIQSQEDLAALTASAEIADLAGAHPADSAAAESVDVGHPHHT